MKVPGCFLGDDDDDEPVAKPIVIPPARVVPTKTDGRFSTGETLWTIAHRWMTEHPEAMALYESLALTAASRGRKFGISLLTEKIRWEYNIIRNDASYKIPNNHRAYIARELISRHPELADFIDCHRIQDDEPSPF